MNGPTLRIRRVGIGTWRENVAHRHRAASIGAPGELPADFVDGGDLS